VLSVLKIAPGSGGASTGSALGARNNPATITATNVNILKVGFILIRGFTFNFSFFVFWLSWGSPSRSRIQDWVLLLVQAPAIAIARGSFDLEWGFHFTVILRKLPEEVFRLLY